MKNLHKKRCSLAGVAALLAGVGFVVSVRLVLLHMQAWLDPNTESFCALSDTVNCDVVARSRWSVVAGVPLAAWGSLYYAAFGLLASARWRWPSVGNGIALTVLATLGAALSLLLATISVFAIESLCLLCVGTYLINAVLLVMAWLPWRSELGPLGRFRSAVVEWRGWLRSPGPLACVFLLGSMALALVFLYPRYWDVSVASASTAGIESEHPALRSGTTEHGHPWIGASKPKVTIVEFSDYQCPYCARAHASLRARLKKHPNVRLVHRHFPLGKDCNPLVDRPFHPQACGYALMAICAGRQGKFWEANDRLYRAQTDQLSLHALANELDLDAKELDRCLDGEGPALLAQDVEAGLELGLQGTPAFVVDDKIYFGRLPDEVGGDG